LTFGSSPIRRYADVVVHRLLIEALENPVKPVPSFTNFELQTLCERLNFMTRVAKSAQRESRDLFFSLFIKSMQSKSADVKFGEIVEAMVVDIRSNGLMIFVPRYHFKHAMVIQSSSKFLRAFDQTRASESLACDVEKDGRIALALKVPSISLSCTFHLFDRILVRLYAAPASKFRLGCCSVEAELVLDSLLSKSKNKKIGERIDRGKVDLHTIRAEVLGEDEKSERNDYSKEKKHQPSLYSLMSNLVHKTTSKKSFISEKDIKMDFSRKQKATRIFFAGSSLKDKKKQSKKG
jgi:hypothetical protein